MLLFVSGKWWFPAAISEHAPALDRQFMITIVVVGFLSRPRRSVSVGWSGNIATRARPGDRAIYSHGSNRLEVLWTVITAVIFITLAVMGQSVWASLRLERCASGFLFG